MKCFLIRVLHCISFLQVPPLELAKIKRKPGAPNTLIYKNKKLTELSKEYKFKYHTLRAAFLRGGIDEYIDIDEG